MSDLSAVHESMSEKTQRKRVKDSNSFFVGEGVEGLTLRQDIDPQRLHNTLQSAVPTQTHQVGFRGKALTVRRVLLESH